MADSKRGEGFDSGIPRGGALLSRGRRGLAGSTTVGFSDQLVLSCPGGKEISFLLHAFH